MNNEWKEITDMESGEVYVLQSKIPIIGYKGVKKYKLTDILFVQADVKPETEDAGLLGSSFKFVKKSKIFVRIFDESTTIFVQKI